LIAAELALAIAVMHGLNVFRQRWRSAHSARRDILAD
jgi:hypothetical protein